MNQPPVPFKQNGKPAPPRYVALNPASFGQEAAGDICQSIEVKAADLLRQGAHDEGKLELIKMARDHGWQNNSGFKRGNGHNGYRNRAKAKAYNRNELRIEL